KIIISDAKCFEKIKNSLMLKFFFLANLSKLSIIKTFSVFSFNEIFSLSEPYEFFAWYLKSFTWFSVGLKDLKSIYIGYLPSFVLCQKMFFAKEVLPDSSEPIMILFLKFVFMRFFESCL